MNKRLNRARTRRCLAAAASLFLAFSLHAQRVEVSVANPLNSARKGETVELPFDTLQSLVQGLSGDHVAVFAEGNRLTCQIVPPADEGRGGLLLFQTDFGPNETKVFTVRNASGREQGRSMVDARFELPRQDLAWENDRIAFRMYGSVLAGDVSNGIDVWTKRVRSLVVDKWYRLSESSPPGHDYYHEDHGEGGDFFNVGRSLGDGGIALVRGDSLYQPGLFTGHRVIATGPIRAVFELSYDSCRMGGLRYNVRELFSLDAGENLNKIQVTYSGFPAGDTLIVAAGIVRRPGVAPAASPNGWTALWGPTNEDPLNGFLGTGVVIPAGSYRGAKEIGRHLLAFAAVPGGKPLTYYAGAGWTRTGDFRSAEEWHAYLDAFARRVAFPLRVSLRAEKK